MYTTDEFTDDGTYEVIDENALAKDVYEKLDEKAEKEHKHTKDEITDFNHTHTVSEISDLDISSFADKEHKHTKDDITTHRYIDNLHNLKSIVPYSLPESFILKI